MIAEITLTTPKNNPESHVGRAPHSDFIIDTVKLINGTSLSELESRLPEFIQRRNQNGFVLGGVLERIRREKFWNPGSNHPKNALFERWVEETCHYSGRKARYLIAVYLGLVQAAIPSSKVADVGWSKLRMIAPLLKPVRGNSGEVDSESTAHNEDLINLARRRSRKALEAVLRSSNGKPSATGDESKHRQRRYVFKVQDDVAEVVDAALKGIAKETGHTGGAALVDMANAVDTPYKTPTLEDMMKKAGREASLSTYVRLFGHPPAYASSGLPPRALRSPPSRPRTDSPSK